MTKEEAKEKIAKLLAKYNQLSPTEINGYHEAKTKQGFIEPLFRALGWDFDNTDEVTPEENHRNYLADILEKCNFIYSSIFLRSVVA